MGGFFYICLNLVSEFFGQNFFWAGQKFQSGGWGTFMFVQIWCQNFLAEIFFWPAENFGRRVLYIWPNLVSEFFSQNFFSASRKFWRGVLLCLSKSGVGIFWPKFFFGQLKNFRGGVLLHFSKNDLGIFSQLWGGTKYENFRMS